MNQVAEETQYFRSDQICQGIIEQGRVGWDGKRHGQGKWYFWDINLIVHFPCGSSLQILPYAFSYATSNLWRLGIFFLLYYPFQSLSISVRLLLKQLCFIYPSMYFHSFPNFTIVTLRTTNSVHWTQYI